jgi:hypothetical protein
VDVVIQLYCHNCCILLVATIVNLDVPNYK